jgi:FixJ family two-component response regulator
VDRAVPLVFIVDDDPSVRKAMGRLIRSLGFEAEVFASAEELLEYEHLDAGACLLVDVRMPGMSGPALQQRLSSLGCRIPMVFVSGGGDVGAQTAAMAAGAAGFLHKPFAEQRLLEAVQEAIHGDCSGTARSGQSAD